MNFSFLPVKFNGIREKISEPIAVSVHKSEPKRLVIRINSDLAEKCGLKSGDMLTPFFDEANKAVLLLSDQRPLPKTARKLHRHAKAFVIDFPRVGMFADFFPLAPMRGMTLREASHGRIVFTIPKI